MYLYALKVVPNTIVIIYYGFRTNPYIDGFEKLLIVALLTL